MTEPAAHRERGATSPTQVDAAVRLRLARAAVEPDTARRYRGTSNRLGAPVDLDTAVDEHIAYCAETRAGILAVDADDQPAAVGVQHLAEQLRDAGHTPVVVASGGAHRLHLFARVDRDFDGWAAEARRQGGDVRGRIRPPLTPHRRDDRPVELLAPGSAEQACRALEPPGEQLESLPASLVRLLRARTPQTPDGTRSATLYAATRRLASRGMDADEAAAIIEAGGGIAADKLAERGHDWWYRYVWAPAADAPRVRGDADPAIDQALGELLAAAQQQAWRGRGDRVAYDVLLALAALASVQATLRVEASIRTLILATGHSYDGIRDALTALQDAGWAQRKRVGGARWQETDEGPVDDPRGSLYQLTRPYMTYECRNSPPKNATPTDQGWYTPGRWPPGDPRAADLICGGVLTLADVHLLSAVEASSPVGAALSALTGAHGSPASRTTQRALERANELGLVELSGRGRGARWRAAADLSDPAVWRAAAEQAGVTGRAAMARRRVEVERADYRAHLAETWAHRVEQAERAKDTWRRERNPARCGASTTTGTACRRPVEAEGRRCASHAEDPHRCGAPTKAGPPCRRPVAAADARCSAHRDDGDVRDAAAVQPALNDDETTNTAS